MSAIESVRPSPIAGSWYSNNPITLRKEITKYLEDAEVPQQTDHVMGLISPHAGYFYSGPTAGFAYKAVQGKKYDLCVIASPLHEFIPYMLLSSAHRAYGTPLGQVDVDQDLLLKFNHSLEAKDLPSLQLIARDHEHSLEIQLPFLQVALAQPFMLLPVMVRTHDPDVLEKTARSLADVIKDKNVLLVASTDLSHFYDIKTATRFDNEMLKQMTNFSPAGVLQAEFNEEGFACGAGAVAMILWTAQFIGANKVNLLHQTTSADSSGDESSVVGYGALSITG